MAVILGNKVTVNTFDKSYLVERGKLLEFFEPDFDRWDWLKESRSQDAHEYHFTRVTEIRDLLKSFDSQTEILKEININHYISTTGDLGNFVFQTKYTHGITIAYYILHLATIDSEGFEETSYNKSEKLRKYATYEYQLASYLYFQYINAADYITGNTKASLNNLVEKFKTNADELLRSIDSISNSAHKILQATNDEYSRVNTKLTKRHSRRIRRYRQVFQTVRQEAALARDSAKDDLKNAYDTYHAQVDLKSSIIYWGEKIAEHNKSKWRWFSAVILSILLTFLSPILYYAVGGVSALAPHSSHISSSDPSLSNPNDTKQNSPALSQTDNKEKTISAMPASSTIEKVVFASGIADLTGAALLVALLSVLLRLCLRQYNVCIYLSHDAEERVTMLKTYLALSNEGKLTTDGDMKLVLETLFRPSQTNGIPDSTPATPIELIIKAFTEKSRP